MCENASGEDFEKKIIVLTRLSAEWFKAHHSDEIALRFTLYVKESQSGSLQNYYARILDSSLECIISVLPLLTNRLSTEISNVVQVPSIKLRPLLSMIVYWLIQFHGGQKRGLPDDVEMLGIINGILTNKVLTFREL